MEAGHVEFARAVLGMKCDTVLLQAIQRLNANPYNLTKAECISELQAMRGAI